MSRFSPPAFACRLFQIVFPVPYRGALLGDLIEEYNLRAESTSPCAATLWFWGQACRSIPFIVGSSLRNGVLKFGAVGPIREDHHAEHGLPFYENLLQDLRFALRMLARSPGFSAVAMLTIALGIGATTAIFSLVDATLLHPLPYPHPEQLVSIEDDLPGVGARDVGMSVPEWQDLRAFRHFSICRAQGSGDDESHRDFAACRESGLSRSRRAISRCWA